MTFDSEIYPYDTIVYITDTIGQEEIQGSGVLIAPDEVLTASHVVYSSTYGTASNITVTPAYNLGSAPYGSASGSYFHYFPIDDPNDTQTLQQSQSDYAVIHLSTSFSGLGTMGLESNFAGGLVNVTGYPAVLDGLMENSPQDVTVNPDYTLLKGTAIGPGSSGGPVWIDSGANGPQVVAIVSTETDGTGTGNFTQITTAAFDQIEAWVAEDNAGTTPLAIIGALSDQVVSDQATIAPFSHVMVSDSNSDQTEGVAILVSDAVNGKLTNLGGGSYNVDTGVYEISGSPAAVTAALDGLVFDPAPNEVPQGQTVTTGFTIAVTDTDGQSATNSATSVVAVSSGAELAPGASYTATQPNQTIVGGGGNTSLTFQSSADLFVGDDGNDTVIDNGSNDTIQAGSGATTVTLDGSLGRSRGGTGNFTVDDPTANSTVIGGTADTMFVTVGASASNSDVFGRAGNTNILDLGADALIGAGSGTGVVNISGAGTQVYGNESGSGTLNVNIGAANALVFGLNNNTTVDTSNVAATGALVFGGFSSIAADNGSLLIQAGADSLVAVTGGSNSTINAGSGDLYAFIGTGSIAGSNVINGASASALYVAFIGGAGSATVFGGEAAASVFGVDGTEATYVNTRAGAPGAFLVADGSTAGGETLNAAGSTTNDSLFAAQGNVSLVAGSGTDILDAGANTGSLGGAGTVVGGDTMVAGGGADLMLYTHGAFAGGAVVINLISADTIFLSGYNAAAGGNQANMALADATNAGGDTTIALADGTTITFVDTTIAQLQGHVFSN